MADLTHLCQAIPPNVQFLIGEHTVAMHSLVLLARSAWFRRSWRMHNSSDPLSTDRSLASQYSFGLTGSAHMPLEIRASSVPSRAHGQFVFKARLQGEAGTAQELFFEAFSQLRLFLYRGACDINASNCRCLLALADAFQVDSLKDSLSVYFCRKTSANDVDALVATAQLAHGNFYQLEEDFF